MHERSHQNNSLQQTWQIPAYINGACYTSIEDQTIIAIDGRELGKLSQVPLIKTHEITARAADTFYGMRNIPSRRIIAGFKRVAALLREENWRFADLTRESYYRVVSAATGFPKASMPGEVEEIATILDNIESIIRVQLPGNIEQTLDYNRFDVPGNQVGYYPAGKNLLVKIPGNVPSIVSYWLVPLALKIPVILIPPPEEPFTHWLLWQAIHFADPELSRYLQFLPCQHAVWSALLSKVERIMLPESSQHEIVNNSLLRTKTHIIHHGRSKLLIVGDWTEAGVGTAYRRMLWNHGRTCTGLTSVILSADADGFCWRLAQRIAATFPAGIEQNLGSLPLFPTLKAHTINDSIEKYMAEGMAEDITAVVGARPRLLEQENYAMFLPTVIWVKQPDCGIFGLELPFPFVTVTSATCENDLLRLARDSLIVSVMGDCETFLEKICFEGSINKVFSGAFVERGYNYLDPHEGYMADFLYTKKAVAGPV